MKERASPACASTRTVRVPKLSLGRTADIPETFCKLANNHGVARREQERPERLGGSGKFCFPVRVEDLNAILKGIAGTLHIVTNISLDTAAPPLGYIAVLLPKCINGKTRLRLFNYVKPGGNFPAKA